MLGPEVLQKFVSIVSPDRCKTAKEDLLTYGYDAGIYEYLPEAVLFSNGTDEVSEIMKVAWANNVFVTPSRINAGPNKGP